MVARCGITDWIRPGARHETWKRFFLITPLTPRAHHTSQGKFDEKQFRNVEPVLKRIRKSIVWIFLRSSPFLTGNDNFAVCWLQVQLINNV